MKVLIIDRDEYRARGLASKLPRDVVVEIWTCVKMVDCRLTRTDGGFTTGKVPQGDGVEEACVTLHHYSDAAWTAPESVEVWYGAGGPEPTPTKGREHSIRRGVTAEAVTGWEEEWLRELVDWAAMDAERRKDRSLPRLLGVPAPDALLAYHLAGLLGQDAAREIRAQIESKALDEAKGIAGRGRFGEDALRDPAKLKAFLLERC